jgi:SAM-dependent methyltransferase
MPKKKQWFENWFNSPYYHILYKERNDTEAELFIDTLLEFLHPEKDARFLDLGCGKGRHSVYLNKKGYNVVGVDLSPESIEFASQFAHEGISGKSGNLEFYVQDMRKTARINYYDYILNLFTSFGYFENKKEDDATIHAVCNALKPHGIFVLDFMNAKKVIANLVTSETKVCEGIEFNITRSVIDNFIVKNIHFSDKGKEYHFQEKVKALTLTDFEKYFAINKLKILHLRGNYTLEAFNENDSDRLIIIGQK